MTAATYSLTFSGYWRSILGVPEQTGLYCVYAGTYDGQGHCELRALLCIGQAEDARYRLRHHDRRADIKEHLRQREVLYYSFAPHTAANIDRIEAALIFRHKPSVNTRYVDSFPFDETTLILSGATDHLQTPRCSVSGYSVQELDRSPPLQAR